MKITDAMTMAKYSKTDLTERRIGQAISKNKNRLIVASLKQLKNVAEAPRRSGTNSSNTITTVSELRNLCIHSCKEW
jgi:hypothetical protein